MYRHSVARLSTLFAALLGLALVATVAHSEDKPMPAGAAKDSKADQAAMMEAMMKAGQPGPEHDRLKAMAGEWTAASKGWNPDGSDCGTGTGVVTYKMILGGRFLQMNYTGEMDTPQGKMPFTGMGFIGYDNGKKKYTSIWMDDISTATMIAQGVADGNVVTCEGEYTDPLTGKPTKMKDISTLIDPTHHKYEMHMSGPDGKMYKCMEIMYTKK